jgi:hypothetical protein
MNMKKLSLNVLLLFSLLIFAASSFSQEVVKYDFLEIIVVQKPNDNGKIKRLEVDDTESLNGSSISIKEIEKIKSTSDLLNYMNAANWEFLERQAIVSGSKDPVWMSYIFRKRK